jgi:hypothetical protein
MKNKDNKLTKKNTLVVWSFSPKKVCITILSYCSTLTRFIPVSSESITFVSANLKDLEFRYPNFTKLERTTKRLKKSNNKKNKKIK